MPGTRFARMSEMSGDPSKWRSSFSVAITCTDWGMGGREVGGREPLTVIVSDAAGSAACASAGDESPPRETTANVDCTAAQSVRREILTVMMCPLWNWSVRRRLFFVFPERHAVALRQLREDVADGELLAAGHAKNRFPDLDQVFETGAEEIALDDPSAQDVLRKALAAASVQGDVLRTDGDLQALARRPARLSVERDELGIGEPQPQRPRRIACRRAEEDVAVADEVGDERRGGREVDLARRAPLHDLAHAHHGDPVPQREPPFLGPRPVERGGLHTRLHIPHPPPAPRAH